MAFQERLQIYNKIQEIRKRPLIVYATSSRQNANAQMGQDVIPHFIRHLESIKDNLDGIDVLIMSSGGDPIVSWRIISLLRNRFKGITVFVPYNAYSAATLLALGADDIIMHINGCLGPVDMQITAQPKNNGDFPKTFSFEDISNYFKFLDEIGLKDQAVISQALVKLSDDVNPLTIGQAKRGSQLGLSMAEKMLTSHMSDGNKAKLISEKLNRNYYHHGYPLDRNEATEIGLNIIINKDVEDLMWQIATDIISEFKENEPFDPQSIAQENIFKLGKTMVSGNVYNDKVDIRYATIESVEMQTCFDSELYITYTRQKDLSLQFSVANVSAKWRAIKE